MIYYTGDIINLNITAQYYIYSTNTNFVAKIYIDGLDKGKLNGGQIGGLDNNNYGIIERKYTATLE